MAGFVNKKQPQYTSLYHNNQQLAFFLFPFFDELYFASIVWRMGKDTNIFKNKGMHSKFTVKNYLILEILYKTESIHQGQKDMPRHADIQCPLAFYKPIMLEQVQWVVSRLCILVLFIM